MLLFDYSLFIDYLLIILVFMIAMIYHGGDLLLFILLVLVRINSGFVLVVGYGCLRIFIIAAIIGGFRFNSINHLFGHSAIPIFSTFLQSYPQFSYQPKTKTPTPSSSPNLDSSFPPISTDTPTQ